MQITSNKRRDDICLVPAWGRVLGKAAGTVKGWNRVRFQDKHSSAQQNLKHGFVSRQRMLRNNQSLRPVRFMVSVKRFGDKRGGRKGGPDVAMVTGLCMDSCSDRKRPSLVLRPRRVSQTPLPPGGSGREQQRRLVFLGPRRSQLLRRPLNEPRRLRLLPEGRFLIC